MKTSIFDQALRSGRTKKATSRTKGKKGAAGKRLQDQVRKELAKLDKIPALVKETKRGLTSRLAGLQLECEPRIATKKPATKKAAAPATKKGRPRKSQPAQLAGGWGGFPMLPAYGQSTVPMLAAPATKKAPSSKRAPKAKKGAQLGLGLEAKTYKCKRCRFKTGDLAEYRTHVLRAHQ